MSTWRGRAERGMATGAQEREQEGEAGDDAVTSGRDGKNALTEADIYPADGEDRDGYRGATAGRFEIVECYAAMLEHDQELSMPVAAVKALSELIATSRANTMSELMETLRDAVATLKKQIANSISLTAGCDLFLRFVTTTGQGHEYPNFHEYRRALIARGRAFPRIALLCKEKIAKLGSEFLKDDMVILLHGYSRVVIHLILKSCIDQGKRLKVFVTDARPSRLGEKTSQVLRDRGIPCIILLDSAVAYAMDKIDLVLVGAEGVVENGGFVNLIGSYQIALVAKAHNKPFYVAAESFKFIRLFPLGQYDLPTHTPDLLSFPEQSRNAGGPLAGTGTKSATIPSSTLAPTPLPERSTPRKVSGFDAPLDRSKPSTPTPTLNLTPTTTPFSPRSALKPALAPAPAAPPPSSRSLDQSPRRAPIHRTSSANATYWTNRTAAGRFKMKHHLGNASGLGLTSTPSSRNGSTHSSSTSDDERPAGVVEEDDLLKNPSVDYTPPELVTLIFSDIGVMSSAGVSDELIQMYHS